MSDLALDIRPYAASDAEEWDDFVENRSGNGTLFQTRRFLSYHPEGRFEDRSVLVRSGGELVCVERDWKAAILGALAMIEDIDDRETGIVLRGAGVSVSDEEALSEAIAGQYPMLELEFVDAGQEIYHWEIGIM